MATPDVTTDLCAELQPYFFPQTQTIYYMNSSNHSRCLKLTEYLIMSDKFFFEHFFFPSLQNVITLRNVCFSLSTSLTDNVSISQRAQKSNYIFLFFSFRFHFTSLTNQGHVIMVFLFLHIFLSWT